MARSLFSVLYLICVPRCLCGLLFERPFVSDPLCGRSFAFAVPSVCVFRACAAPCLCGTLLVRPHVWVVSRLCRPLLARLPVCATHCLYAQLYAGTLFLSYIVCGQPSLVRKPVYVVPCSCGPLCGRFLVLTVPCVCAPFCLCCSVFVRSIVLCKLLDCAVPCLRSPL